MSYWLKLRIDQLPKTINDIGRKHWWTKVKEIKEWEAIIHFQTLGKRPMKPLEKASVKFTRHSSRCPDYDNLAQSFKAVLDCLVKSKILKNDSMEVIGKPEYHWEKTKSRKGYIEIEVLSEEDERASIPGETKGSPAS